MVSDELRVSKLTPTNVTAWSRQLYAWLSKQKQEDFNDFLLPLSSAQNCFDFGAKLALLVKNQDSSAFDDGRVPTDYWMIFFGREIIGYAKTRALLDRNSIHEGGHIRLGIDPQHRGKGYGTKVLDILVKYLAGDGVKDIFMSCFVENDAARNLIAAAGGKEESIGDSWMYPGHEILRFWIHK